MHPEWLSNAYFIADMTGGTGVFVDSGAPLQPLFDAVDRHGVRVTHLLTTHADHDHIAGDEQVLREFGLKHATTRGLLTGGLEIEALKTPGHKDDHLAYVFNGELVCTGDVLFKDAVGGGDLDQIRRSVMEVLMQLPDQMRVLPGHTEETTIGREREENPFVRVWRGAQPEGTEPVRVGGENATLIVWSPDYDGNGKAWVRFDDGRDAIVGGSRVERG